MGGGCTRSGQSDALACSSKIVPCDVTKRQELSFLLLANKVEPLAEGSDRLDAVLAIVGSWEDANGVRLAIEPDAIECVFQERDSLIYSTAAILAGSIVEDENVISHSTRHKEVERKLADGAVGVLPLKMSRLDVAEAREDSSGCEDGKGLDSVALVNVEDGVRSAFCARGAVIIDGTRDESV